MFAVEAGVDFAKLSWGRGNQVIAAPFYGTVFAITGSHAGVWKLNVTRPFSSYL